MSGACDDVNRPKLKRLVADGVLAQLELGLFTAAGAAA